MQGWRKPNKTGVILVALCYYTRNEKLQNTCIHVAAILESWNYTML